MNIGDKAPDVLGRDENGNEIKLDDFKGRKLALYFYPKDMTSGCTTEACNLRDNYDELRRQGFDVVGVSVDEVRNYFGGRHFDSEGGSPVGIHMEKGPDGGVVTLDDSAILDCALRIIAETEAAKQQV